MEVVTVDADVRRSGAIITLGEGMVVKTGGPRVRAQGVYLLQLRDAGVKCVPEIRQVLNEGYVMEQLDPVSDEVSTVDVLALSAEIWNAPVPVVDWCVLDVLSYAATRANVWLPPMLAGKFLAHGEDVLGRVTEHVHPVHGDLTLENVMRRGGGELVLIDPIPPARHLPGTRWLDRGKMLQSAWGWETRTMREAASGPAACWFGCYALLRLLPYYREDPVVVEWALKTLRREVGRWE